MAVLIEGVESASPAMRSGMQVGETLLSINGNEISDVLDYRFYNFFNYVSNNGIIFYV